MVSTPVTTTMADRYGGYRSDRPGHPRDCHRGGKHDCNARPAIEVVV